jgi:hypothetical protein
MLAEFKYELEPKESFAQYFGDQKIPSRLYYHFKKDLFPLAYWNAMVRVIDVLWFNYPDNWFRLKETGSV